MFVIRVYRMSLLESGIELGLLFLKGIRNRNGCIVLETLVFFYY